MAGGVGVKGHWRTFVLPDGTRIRRFVRTHTRREPPASFDPGDVDDVLLRTLREEEGAAQRRELMGEAEAEPQAARRLQDLLVGPAERADDPYIAPETYGPTAYMERQRRLRFLAKRGRL